MRFAGIIAALGNPGKKYEATRHNFGFMVLDALLAELSRFSPDSVVKHKADKNGESFELRFAPGLPPYLAVRPLTYMNLSGRAVAPLANFYKLAPENVLAVHDELDLPLGKLKFKQGGGPAGNNGVASLIECLGSRDFTRLRLGVGRPGAGEAANYVLGTFRPDEKPVVERVVEAAVDGIRSYAERGLPAAMERINGLDFTPAEEG